MVCKLTNFKYRKHTFFRQHLDDFRQEVVLIVIQCDSGNSNANLIACARNCALDECEKSKERRELPAHIVFIIQLPRKKGGCFTGFQVGVFAQ